MNRAEAFRLLEIPENSSTEEAKKAYRRLAMKWHPDRNKEPGAEAKFKQIKEAYELIESEKAGSSSNTNQQYRTWNGNNSTAGSTNFEDLAEFLRAMHGKGFSEAFKASRPKVDPIDDYKDQWGASGPGAKEYQQRGGTNVVNVKLTLEEAFVGCKKRINVPNEYSISGSLTDVQIPAGLSDGDLIRTFESPGHSTRVFARIITDYSVKFGPGIDSMEPPHSSAGNIERPIEVSVITMVTGGTIEYKTIDGASVNVRIPAGIEAFRALRLKERGYWKAARRRDRGDCFLRLVPKIQRLDELSYEQLEELKKNIQYAEELRKSK